MDQQETRHFVKSVGLPAVFLSAVLVADWRALPGCLTPCLKPAM
jgi:hypothetical protein